MTLTPTRRSFPSSLTSKTCVPSSSETQTGSMLLAGRQQIEAWLTLWRAILPAFDWTRVAARTARSALSSQPGAATSSRKTRYQSLGRQMAGMSLLLIRHNRTRSSSSIDRATFSHGLSSAATPAGFPIAHTSSTETTQILQRQGQAGSNLICERTGGGSWHERPIVSGQDSHPMERSSPTTTGSRKASSFICPLGKSDFLYVGRSRRCGLPIRRC